MVLSPFCKWDTVGCKNFIGFSWATQITNDGHWGWNPGLPESLRSCSPSWTTLPVSQLQIARWWNATTEKNVTTEKAHWGKVETDVLQNINENYTSAFARKCSCCLYFCFWWIVSAWYWKVNHKPKGKILCVAGQKPGKKIKETFRFVPVLRSDLEGLVQYHATHAEMSFALRDLALTGQIECWQWGSPKRREPHLIRKWGLKFWKLLFCRYYEFHIGGHFL